MTRMASASALAYRSRGARATASGTVRMRSRRCSACLRAPPRGRPGDQAGRAGAQHAKHPPGLAAAAAAHAWRLRIRGVGRVQHAMADTARPQLSVSCRRVIQARGRTRLRRRRRWRLRCPRRRRRPRRAPRQPRPRRWPPRWRPQAGPPSTGKQPAARGAGSERQMFACFTPAAAA